MRHQRLYNGVRLLGEGPSPLNVARLDAGSIPMVHHMMQWGIQVDLGYMAQIERELTDDMEALTADVAQLAGHYINLGSGDQVSQFLFKELGLQQARRNFTASGKRESVENEVLVAIQHTHPVISKLLDYKEYEKLRGTYAIPIQKLAKKTAFGQWRLFPNLKTTFVPSGRFSCEDPNLLAMPNRTPRGRDVLKGFITDLGWTLLSVDESQIEPRTVAHRSQDPALMAVYHNQEDIYSDFAINAFSLPDQRYRDAEGWHYPGVDKKLHRFPSKTCTLASIYRVTYKGLVDQMPVICANCLVEGSKHRVEDCPRGFLARWDEDHCQDLINSFYLRYSGITPMQQRDDKRARRYTYVWDDWGRFMHTTGVRSVHPWIVAATLREAGNLPIQGFACGTLKLVMAEVFDDLQQGHLLDVCHPLLPIHDEILLECRRDIAEEVGEHIAERFRRCVELTVPLDADWAMAETWGEIVK